MGVSKCCTIGDLVQWQKDLRTALMEMGLDPDQKHPIVVIHEASMRFCRRYFES